MTWPFVVSPRRVLVGVAFSALIIAGNLIDPRPGEGKNPHPARIARTEAVR